MEKLHLKFQASSVKTAGDGDQGTDTMRVELHAVADDGVADHAKFWKYTPAGELVFELVNEESARMFQDTEFFDVFISAEKEDDLEASEVVHHNSSIAHVLQFFSYAHLPLKMQAVSKQFHDLAHMLASTIPGNQELIVALRKLLEGKDAAVRATLVKPN